MKDNINTLSALSMPRLSSEEQELFSKQKHFPRWLLNRLSERAGVDLRNMTLDEAVEKFIAFYIG